MVIEFVALDLSHDWGWVHDHIGLVRTEDTRAILARDVDTHERHGAVIMQNWSRTSCRAHMIIVNPMVLRHGFLEEAFAYIFTYLDRVKVFGHVRSDNMKALKLNKHIGFTEVARLTDAYEPFVDDVIVELHRDDCRFWEPGRLQANGR